MLDNINSPKVLSMGEFMYLWWYVLKLLILDIKVLCRTVMPGALGSGTCVISIDAVYPATRPVHSACEIQPSDYRRVSTQKKDICQHVFNANQII